MRPPPPPARRAAPPAPATDGRESLWHVAIAPDDVKVLTLDKLDDLFRLDIIDESTQIWRPGMASWQPLGVVANISPAPSEPTRVESPPSTGRPAPAAHRVPRAMDSDHPTPVVTSLSTMQLWPMADAPALTTRTEVVAPPAEMLAASRPTPPPPVAASFSALSLHEPPVTSFSAPSFHEPPVAASFSALSLHEKLDAAPRARGTGRAQRLMLALSVVAGLTVTLYRNDVFLDAARSAGGERVYQQLESALGGPGFGTPRSLERLGLSTGRALTK